MLIGIDCHVLETKRTGTARYLINLLQEWSKLISNSEFSVFSFVLYFKNKIPKDIPQSKNFKTKILKTSNSVKLAKGNAYFEHILLPIAIKKDKLDFFFSPNYILPLQIPKKTKTIVAIHDISYEAHPEWFSWQNKILLKLISKKSAKRADIIFTCSNFTKKEIVKYYKMNPQKIHAIPLAAENKFRKIKCPIGKIKKEYGVKNKFIFYVGAIFNRRFVLETVKAFSELSTKLPQYQLLIGGPNYTCPYTNIDKIIENINTKLKTKSIIHINYIKEKDLIDLYNCADLFIWLSEYEGFGLPPLEAMSCGTPVVTTNKSSLPEVVGDSAIFIKDPRDINEINNTLYRVLINEDLKNKLTKEGLAQSQRFSWKKTAKQTLNIIKNL